MIATKLRTAAWQKTFLLLDRLPGRRAALPKHLQTGLAGEDAAFFFLREAGFTVIARKWQSGRAPGDLDLVAWEGEELCFVEVKTRSGRAVATAEAAVDGHKRMSLRRLAGYYLRQLPDGTPTRFDILSIYRRPDQAARRPEFELFRGAFGWTERELP